jgi:hypothetical protein
MHANLRPQSLRQILEAHSCLFNSSR